MISKVEFDKQIFQSHGILNSKIEKGFDRVPARWIPSNSNSADFRAKISDIILNKAEEYRSENKVKTPVYEFIELSCRIPVDSVKKAVSGRYKITRNFLAKFTVGLKLEIECANSLFKEHSGELNLTNDFDYIVYHALKTKDDIDYFIDEMEQYTGINLDRDKL